MRPYQIITFLVSIGLLKCSSLFGLTMAEAIDKAIESNQNVKVAESRVSEYQQRITAVRSAYLPRLELSGTYTYVSRLSEIKINLPLPGPLPEITTGTQNMIDTKLSGKYRLFDWGKRRKMVGQAILGKELGEASVYGTKHGVAYQVVRSYATTALIVEQRRLLDRYLAISQKHLNDARNKYDLGLVSQFDLLKSELQLKVYQEQVAIEDAELNIARHRLSEILGIDEGMVEVTELLSELVISEPSLAEDGMNKQIGSKPEITAFRKQQEISNLALGLERLRPTVSLFTSAGWKNSYMPDPDKLLFNYAGGVAISYEFFDGGYAKSRRAEEVAKQRSLELEIERVTSEAETATLIFREEVAKISAKSKITTEKLALARKAMEIASVSYNSGMITNAEYLDTELQVQQIETESLQDKYSLLMAQIEIKKALSYWPEID